MDETTIDKLVKLHGEGGLAPTAADWREICRLPAEVRLLNLLAFESEVDDGDARVTGADAYRRYSEGVGPVFAQVGGQRLFFGTVSHVFGTEQPDVWDAAVLTSYPSARALVDMWLDPQFINAHRHRHAGVARSQVLVF